MKMHESYITLILLNFFWGQRLRLVSTPRCCFPMAQMVKHRPAMWETWVWSLGLEDPLEKETAPVFLPGKFHRQRSLVGYSPWGCKESDAIEHFTSTSNTKDWWKSSLAAVQTLFAYGMNWSHSLCCCPFTLPCNPAQHGHLTLFPGIPNIYIYMCVCVRIYTYMYTLIFMYVYTHTHMYI